MPVIQVEARVSPEQLLRAVDQMSPEELAAFTRQVIELRARREAALLSADESLLLERINRGQDTARRLRYEALLARRDDGTLTDDEHAELIALSDEREGLDADRIAAVAELARLRGVSLGAMVSALGLPDTGR